MGSRIDLPADWTQDSGQPENNPAWAGSLKRIVLSRWCETALCCATGIGIPVLLAGYRASLHIRLRDIEVPLRRLPPAFDGYRLLHISDIHATAIGRRERALIELAAATPADLLLLGGDYQMKRVERSPAAALEVCRRLAEAREWPDGAVAIRGNHDEREMHRLLRIQDFMRYLRDGVQVIRRGAEALATCGAAYPGVDPARHWRGQRRMLPLVPSGAARILLAHAPDAFPSAARMGFDFAIAGDTHGGQLRLPLLGPVLRKTRLPRRYALGLHDYEGMPCCTSAGIGVIGLPARINCPPEIIRVTLRRAAHS